MAGGRAVRRHCHLTCQGGKKTEMSETEEKITRKEGTHKECFYSAEKVE